MLDLTVPGCLLQTAMPLERGQDVQLLIFLEGSRHMRVTLGIVRWVSGKTAGIEFIRMSAGDQERLRIVVGVKPQLRVRRLYWEVQWPIENGRSRHRKFSILKYGEEGAYQLALAARETALEVLASQTFSPYDTLSGRSGMRT